MSDKIREALITLVELHKGYWVHDSEYRRRSPAAWQAAYDAVAMVDMERIEAGKAAECPLHGANCDEWNAIQLRIDPKNKAAECSGDPTICPDCGRPKALSADDCMSGLCPKWYAVRDKEAKQDCDKARTSKAAQDSRQRFEAWARTDDGNCNELDLRRDANCSYNNRLVERDWLVWQARAALPPTPALVAK